MSEHLKQIRLKTLSLQKFDKIVLLGILILVLGLFFPWFSIRTSDIFAANLSKIFIAFTGLTYIVGYLVYLLAIFSLYKIDRKMTILLAGITFILFLLNLIFSQKEEGITFFATFLFLSMNIAFIFTLDHFSLFKQSKKQFVNIFVGLQCLILIFVSSMIYHGYALNFTDASVNFGLYLSAIGAGLILYGGYTEMQQEKKKANKEMLSPRQGKFHGGIHLKPDLNIDTSKNKQNNTLEEKHHSQLSLGDYE